MAASTSHFLSFLLPSSPKSAPPPNPKFPKPPRQSQSQFPAFSSSISSNPQLSPLMKEKKKEGKGLMAASAAAGSTDLASLLCPSLAYANILHFKSSGYNVQVVVEDNEPEERLLNRFRREVMRAGVIQECKRRRYFENHQDERKRKTREAAKRNSRRRRTQIRFSPQSRPEGTPKTEKDNDDDKDNWELPQGDLPY